MSSKNDFSKGSIPRNILNIAFPMTLAQLISVLYNIVDRIYIGKIPENATLALTGLGVTLPIITIVIALLIYLVWGCPLSSIARGREIMKREEIMGNSFFAINFQFY